jgi:hypothetical protein
MSLRMIYLKRLAKIGGACFLIFATIGVFIYGARHFITQNIDDFFRWPPDKKESFFLETFPSRREIEDYLLNTTILISHPPIGNSVYYFDKDQHTFNWHGNQIIKGHWFLYPMIDRRVYNGKWRFDLAYSFCRELDDGSFTEDNCILLGSTSQIFAGFGELDYAKGDIFDLSNRSKPPFTMPTTAISIEQLRTAISQLRQP